MVKIGDVILGLKSRLGDTDSASPRYSDPEIIDAVNSALSHLSEELLCFRRTWFVPCADGVGRYELPGDFLRLISVKYKDEIITDIESMEHRMTRRDGTADFGVSLDMQTVHIFPAENIEKEDVIELYYHYFETVSDTRDTVSLPNSAKEAIVFYVLYLLYQNPIKKDGLKISAQYFQNYQMSLRALRSRVRMNAQSKNMQTAYRKV